MTRAELIEFLREHRLAVQLVLTTSRTSENLRHGPRIAEVAP